ncbi:hypothetical protein AVEN_140363-1 [Araneus ventricosus]|uniref:Uncharacterized protein n=1 Tax=Araneus ventricosus TaxID=182803 RepID=A0A4Y2P2X2_ARAVE|nr:hypothetical protein AVEN_140363-1 [Araneus ventricosus]
MAIAGCTLPHLSGKVRLPSKLNFGCLEGSQSLIQRATLSYVRCGRNLTGLVGIDKLIKACLDPKFTCSRTEYVVIHTDVHYRTVHYKRNKLSIGDCILYYYLTYGMKYLQPSMKMFFSEYWKLVEYYMCLQGTTSATECVFSLVINSSGQ